MVNDNVCVVIKMKKNYFDTEDLNDMKALFRIAGVLSAIFAGIFFWQFFQSRYANLVIMGFFSLIFCLFMFVGACTMRILLEIKKNGKKKKTRS